MKISITEVSPRDGLQSEIIFFDTSRKIELIRKVIASGVSRIEVTSFVSPRAVPQMADAEDVIAGVSSDKRVVLEALVPNLRGAERAARTAVHEWVGFVSASESHSQANTNCSVSQALTRLARVASLALECNRKPVAAIATAFGCPFEGVTPVSRTLDVAKCLFQMGYKTIKLGDTVGTAHPAQVRELLPRLQQELPEAEFVMHLHDTRGFSLANVQVALSLGIARFESSVGGLGGCPFAPGASGNVATEDLVHFLHAEGFETGCDLDRLIATGKWMETTLARQLPARMLRTTPLGVTVPFEEARRAVG